MLLGDMSLICGILYSSEIFPAMQCKIFGISEQRFATPFTPHIISSQTDSSDNGEDIDDSHQKMTGSARAA